MRLDKKVQVLGLVLACSLIVLAWIVGGHSHQIDRLSKEIDAIQYNIYLLELYRDDLVINQGAIQEELRK